jgi:hypothetical protein
MSSSDLLAPKNVRGFSSRDISAWLTHRAAGARDPRRLPDAGHRQRVGRGGDGQHVSVRAGGRGLHLPRAAACCGGRGAHSLRVTHTPPHTHPAWTPTAPHGL